jgi:hypothetical protein
MNKPLDLCPDYKFIECLHYADPLIYALIVCLIVIVATQVLKWIFRICKWAASHNRFTKRKTLDAQEQQGLIE